MTIERPLAALAKSGFVVALICAALSSFNLLRGAETKENPWESHIQRFEKRDQESPPPQGAVLFVGSSTIGMWDTNKHFPGVKTINRGFGGSHISDAVHFAPRIVIPYKPRVIVFSSGSNDIKAGKKPAEVADDFKKFVEVVHAELPNTKIVFSAIKPTIQRWKQDPQMRETNQLIEDFMQGNKNLVYVDTYTPFLGEDGLPRKDLLLDDGLHLNQEGYVLLTRIVAPAIGD